MGLYNTRSSVLVAGDPVPAMTTGNSGLSARLLRNPVHCLSLGFGSGLSPQAPGTCGTLVGVLIYLPMRGLDLPIYLVLLAALFATGVVVCGRTTKMLGCHDHGAIVWDEIVGYLATMVFAPRDWVWMLVGFVLFRFFDILKPPPVRRLERLKGGYGVVLDDVMAGLYANIVLHIVRFILK